MQFNAIFLGTALLASASLVMSSTIITFAGADCTGTIETENFNVGSNVCLTDGSNSVKSISYSGVGSEIQFFVSGGGHDNCSNGPSLTLGGGSGCATAPPG